MNKKSFLLILISIVWISKGFAQLNHAIKAEVAYLQFGFNTLNVDPGPNWKGYNLNNENGIDFTIVNSLNFKNKFLAGVGIAYLNFEGINGVSLFSDFEYLPLKTRLTPLINLKIGYSHIWNQYENGKGTGLTEFNLGLNFRLSEKIDIYSKSGFLMTQQSFLVPIRIGMKFCRN